MTLRETYFLELITALRNFIEADQTQTTDISGHAAGTLLAAVDSLKLTDAALAVKSRLDILRQRRDSAESRQVQAVKDLESAKQLYAVALGGEAEAAVQAARAELVKFEIEDSVLKTELATLRPLISQAETEFDATTKQGSEALHIATRDTHLQRQVEAGKALLAVFGGQDVRDAVLAYFVSGAVVDGCGHDPSQFLTHAMHAIHPGLPWSYQA